MPTPWPIIENLIKSRELKCLTDRSLTVRVASWRSLCRSPDSDPRPKAKRNLQSYRISAPTSFQNKIKGEVRYDEIMSKYTSMRIGGPADVFVLPESLRDLQIILKHRGSCPVWTLGEGTNLLVRDRGIRGIVVSLKNCFKSIKRPVFYKTPDGKERAVIQVDGGVKLSYLAKYAARYGLTGIESLVGIPGSVGGAVVMNAGAEGTEIGQVLRSVKRVNLDGEVETFDKDDITNRHI